MRIGELSRHTAAVPIHTLRFYERKKLLREPPRTSSGYRSYGESDLARVRFIREAQELGFTLREIHEPLKIHEPEGAPPLGQIVPTGPRLSASRKNVRRSSSTRLKS